MKYIFSGKVGDKNSHFDLNRIKVKQGNAPLITCPNAPLLSVFKKILYPTIGARGGSLIHKSFFLLLL